MWREKLVSGFSFLFLQMNDGDGFAAALFGFEGVFVNEGMVGEKFADALAERSCSVAVDDADLREARQGGVIEEFFEEIGGFFDAHADDVDFGGGGGGSGLRGYGDVGSGWGQPRPYRGAVTDGSAGRGLFYGEDSV